MYDISQNAVLPLYHSLQLHNRIVEELEASHRDALAAAAEQLESQRVDLLSASESLES